MHTHPSPPPCLFLGPTAFSSWTYNILYHPVSQIDVNTNLTTTDTSIVLTALQPQKLYQLTITAHGPGDRGPSASIEFDTTRLSTRECMYTLIFFVNQ